MSQTRIWLAGLTLAGLGFASAAGAAPLAPAASDALAGGAAIERVAEGCGPGIRRNRFGECKQAIGQVTFDRRWRARNGYDPDDDRIAPPPGAFERSQARRYGYGGYGYRPY